MNFMLLKWIAVNTSWEVKKLESSLWIHSLVWQLCVAHGLLGPADAGWKWDSFCSHEAYSPVVGDGQWVWR